MQAGRIVITTLFLASLASGCRKASSSSVATVDTTAARASVDSAMRAHFAAFQQGDMAAWSSLMREDVFFTAADPAQVFVNRDTLQAEMTRSFTPAINAGLKVSVTPRESLVWVDSDGKSATASYDLDYNVELQGKSYPYRLRASYVLAKDTMGWQALAAQYSRPIGYDSLFMALGSHRIAGVHAVGGQIALPAGEIAHQFRADIRDISKAAFAPNAVVVSPGAIVQGAEAARQELKQWLGPPGSATEPGDGIRSMLTPSATVGWVGTNLHVPIFAGPESIVTAMRALFVYRLANNRWEIVQANLSVGLKAPS